MRIVDGIIKAAGKTDEIRGWQSELQFREKTDV